MSDEYMDEGEKAELSRTRGDAASKMPPGEAKREYIARQGNLETKNKGKVGKLTGLTMRDPDYPPNPTKDDTQNVKAYHKGGKVKGRKKGKVVRAKLKVGERVLTARQDKKYGKMKKMYKR